MWQASWLNLEFLQNVEQTIEPIITMPNEDEANNQVIKLMV